MLRKGVPIDSKEASAVTIAKVLGKSEKTIRTHRDKAFAAIRTAMSGEES
jgi:DNA-directed RNA polymerase specialized sigma24 family protein